MSTNTAEELERRLLSMLLGQRVSSIGQSLSTKGPSKKKTPPSELQKQSHSDSSNLPLLVLLEKSHSQYERLRPVCDRHPFFEQVALPMAVAKQRPDLKDNFGSLFTASNSAVGKADTVAQYLYQRFAQTQSESEKRGHFLADSCFLLRLPVTHKVERAVNIPDPIQDDAEQYTSDVCPDKRSKLEQKLRIALGDACHLVKPSQETQEENMHDTQTTLSVGTALVRIHQFLTANLTAEDQRVAGDRFTFVAKELALLLLGSAAQCTYRHDLPRLVWERFQTTSQSSLCTTATVPSAPVATDNHTAKEDASFLWQGLQDTRTSEHVATATVSRIPSVITSDRQDITERKGVKRQRTNIIAPLMIDSQMDSSRVATFIDPFQKALDQSLSMRRLYHLHRHLFSVAANLEASENSDKTRHEGSRNPVEEAYAALRAVLAAVPPTKKMEEKGKVEQKQNLNDGKSASTTTTTSGVRLLIEKKDVELAMVLCPIVY